MAGSRPAGPLGLATTINIDPGTLCRHASPAPSILGVPPLKLDEELSDPTLSFRLAVREALRRGATSLDVSLLRMYFDSSTACADASLSEMGNILITQQEEDAFAKVIESEFKQLPQDFTGGKWSPVKDMDHYRFHVRPIYYAYGYTEPIEILKQMTAHSVLNKSPVWIHQDYADILKKLPTVLDKWRPGLAASMGRQIKSLLGLQIRPIAGSSTLSNHALGCAIDIDAYANPRIYGAQVIEVFNRAARSEGVQFDFGKAVLPEKERGNGEYTEDDVVEIYNRGVPASNAVRAWLKRNLPRYRELMKRIENGERQLKRTHAPSTPLLKRLAADETAAKQAGAKEVAAVLRAEAKAAKANSVGGVCESPAIAAETAIADIRAAADEILCHLDLSGIQLLYENYEPKYIETWEKEGVLNIPLALAAALVGPLKLKWGQQYKDSKDAMHFELVKPGTKRHEPYVAPSAPLARGEKARTLSAFMDQHFKLATPKWISAGRTKR